MTLVGLHRPTLAGKVGRMHVALLYQRSALIRLSHRVTSGGKSSALGATKDDFCSRLDHSCATECCVEL